MKKIHYLSLLLFTITLSCSTEDCGNFQIPIKYEGVPIHLDMGYCEERGKVNYFAVGGGQEEVLDFAKSVDNYFSVEEGGGSGFLTLNSKSKTLAQKYSYNCNYREPSVEVRFMEKLAGKGDQEELHSELPVCKNSFEYEVDDFTLIEKVSIKVNSLDKPYGVAFYDSSGEENRRLVFVVPRCGVLEFSDFHKHWTNVNFILGYDDKDTKKMFKGKIRGGYLEELF